MDLFVPPLDKEKVLTRQIEGTRLTLLRPREIGLTLERLSYIIPMFFFHLKTLKRLTLLS
jgi:hypothetical protein